MPLPPSRDDLVDVLLDQLRAAASEPAIEARPYAVGTTGISVDLAAAADELIGFVVRSADDPLDGVERQLAVCARYFDRVVLAVAVEHVADAARLDLAGAALWSIAEGTIAEEVAGRPNTVSPAALFELMTPDQRSRLLRPALSVGAAYDRQRPPVAAEQARAHVAAHLDQPRQVYWRAFG